MAQQEYQIPPLVETDWLADHLADRNLRILDCTALVRRNNRGEWIPRSGLRAWQRGHIPGSGFADLVDDLADPKPALLFAMPSAPRFARYMSGYGVGEGTQVVLYDRNGGAWAARTWWMLRCFGFEKAAVLNGGWHKWKAENRPVSAAPPEHPRGMFVPRPRPGFIASKADVLAGIADESVCIIDSREPGEFKETHIPGSVNCPAAELVDPKTQCYLRPDELKRKLPAWENRESKRFITYCRAGIVAGVTAFVLRTLGAPNVSVYDGSLMEWTAEARD